MKTYEAYKDCGIEWIGEIPHNWQVIPMRFLLRKKITDGPHETPKFISDGIPFLSVDGIQNGELVFDGCRKISVEDFQRFKEKCIVEKHDILMGKATSVGKVAQVKVDFEFSIWSPLALLKPNHSIIIPSYFEYFLKSNHAKDNANILSTFNTQQNISMADIPRIYFVVPKKIEEQNAIANYLDLKTAEIDQLIAEKEQLVALYQEEKKAIINQAVTKGINPEIKLKDSGIDWLGDIPEHWEVKPLKVMISKKIDNRGKTPQYSDTGKPMLEIKQISEKHKHPIEQFEKFVDIDILQNYVRDELMEGDILIATVGATAGKCCIVPKNPYYFIAQNVIGFRFHKEYSSDFVYYLIQSDFFKQSLYAINKSNTIDNLKVSVFVNNNVPTTEYSEQIEIKQQIEKESVRIDAKISKAEKHINLLTEFRTALISEVVTGKLKVID